ncbi:MAG TPA: TlyA family RNA methyltransferase [Blastocatellia bacterium]|nr:TlyA family RNA methyltransferase [Blastocatellia bacterium]
MIKERIDKVLVERGLAETRARAQAVILAGQVLVAGQRVDKAGQLVDTSAEIRLKGETLRYVGRGGLKLEAALATFGIDPSGRHCIDVGASTGGFTDCLLQHGAAHVWAIDVGHNQLDWRLRGDSRVTAIEGINARNVTPDQFPGQFALATVDVSFISLDKILAPVARLLEDRADLIALVKPQFEVGKGEVGKGGIVTSPEKHRAVIRKVIKAGGAAGLEAMGLIPSPILGAEGNREFLVHFIRTAAQPGDSLRMEAAILAITS